MQHERNVIHEDEAEVLERPHGETFAGQGTLLGAAAGSENLGCTLFEVPPDRSPVPYHYHNANEEALYILEGKGTLRGNSGEEEISNGDYVAFPVGEEGAHQITNTATETLRYLCFSTKREPDVIVYPDSDKILVSGEAPGAPNKILRADAEADYWDGE
jgi:uncharacterized cupin superfamily protein